MLMCVVMSFFRQHLLLSRHFVCVAVSYCKIDDSKILKKTLIYLHMFMNECVQIHALFIFNTSLVHFMIILHFWYVYLWGLRFLLITFKINRLPLHKYYVWICIFFVCSVFWWLVSCTCKFNKKNITKNKISFDRCKYSIPSSEHCSYWLWQ